MYSDDESVTEYVEIEPDRSRADFYCRVCDSHMNTMQIWNMHISGQRHVKNMKKNARELASSSSNANAAPVPNGRIRPRIQRTLDEYEGALLGLSFLTERQPAIAKSDCIYQCHLCQGSFTKINVIDHLVSMKHKMAFFRKSDPATFRIIDGMKHLGKQAIESLVEEHVEEWERKNGRQKMEVQLPKTPRSWLRDLSPPRIRSFGVRNSSRHQSTGSVRSDPNREPEPPVSSDSAAEGGGGERPPLTMASFKNYYLPKMSLDQKLKFTEFVIGTIDWKDKEVLGASLPVYQSVAKVAQLPVLRSLPKELKKRVYEDFGKNPPLVKDVVDDIRKGKKSYYFTKEPFGDDGGA